MMQAYRSGDPRPRRSPSRRARHRQEATKGHAQSDPGPVQVHRAGCPIRHGGGCAGATPRAAAHPRPRAPAPAPRNLSGVLDLVLGAVRLHREFGWCVRVPAAANDRAQLPGSRPTFGPCRCRPQRGSNDATHPPEIPSPRESAQNSDRQRALVPAKVHRSWASRSP